MRPIPPASMRAALPLSFARSRGSRWLRLLNILNLSNRFNAREVGSHLQPGDRWVSDDTVAQQAECGTSVVMNANNAQQSWFHQGYLCQCRNCVLLRFSREQQHKNSWASRTVSASTIKKGCPPQKNVLHDVVQTT